jgi:hypothetical protein
MASTVMPSPTFFPRRINMFVEGMQFADEVNCNGPTRVPFGAPLAANATNIFNASALNAGAVTTLDGTGVQNAQLIDAPWGRVLQVTASTTNTTVVSIYGADYLGQNIREDVTMASAGVVLTKKAFKYVDTVVCPANAGTFSMGYGAGLGLPYKALRVEYEVANGLAAAAGTLTPAVLTDPQTATTGDPRGTYITTTALNGVNVISAVFDCVNDVNTLYHGGLHGVKQFAA